MTRMKEQAKFGVDNPVRGARALSCLFRSYGAEIYFPASWIVVQYNS
jgi:hypothetical protein